MAKRFTDTSKWRRPWFRSLSVQAKVLWQYLIDECDHCGIWIADFDLVSFQVGFKVDEERLAEWLGEKIVKLTHDRYFIPSFFEFQYSDAKDGFKAKQSAIKTLRYWNLLDENECLIDLSNSYLSVTRHSVECPSKIKIKSKIKINGECEGKFDFGVIYDAYPRKVGKEKGLKICRAQIKTPEDFEALSLAVSRYRSHLKAEGTEPKYILHFSTFMGQWRDWLDPATGEAESFAKDKNHIEGLNEIFEGAT